MTEDMQLSLDWKTGSRERVDDLVKLMQPPPVPTPHLHDKGSLKAVLFFFLPKLEVSG